MIKLGLIQSKKENIFGTNSSAYKKNTRRAKCCLTSNKGIFKQNKIVTPQRGGGQLLTTLTLGIGRDMGEVIHFQKDFSEYNIIYLIFLMTLKDERSR